MFGLGTALYQEHFCRAAKDVHAGLDALGAAALLPVATGDDAGELLDKFRKWADTVVKKVRTEVYGHGGGRGVASARGGEKAAPLGQRRSEQGEHKAEPSPLRPSPPSVGAGSAKGLGDGDDTSSVSTEVFNARRPKAAAGAGAGAGRGRGR